MARTVTLGRLALLLDARRQNGARVFVEDPDSVYRDVSALFGFNFLFGASTTDNNDQPVASATVTLRREHRGTDGVLYSLAPTVAASPINRNAADAYARFLKAGRGIRVYLGWDGPAPATVDYPADFLEVFRGKIDEVDWKGKESRVTLACRDLGAWLLDKFIEDETNYGDDAGVPMETVMQQILDDNEEPRLGPVVLYVPVSPGVMLKAFKQERKPVLTALKDLAYQIGWDVRYRWQADNSFRLELFQPDRAKVVPDWTLGPLNYYDVAQLKETDADVRNKIRGKATTADGDPLLSEVSDADSINEHGTRFMEFVEATTSNIDTQAELDAMTAAALADLKDPLDDQEIENMLFPIAQLGDLGRWLANGKHYDADQDLAIVQVRHEFTAETRRSFVQSRGTVGAGVKEWLRRGHSTFDGGGTEDTFDPSTIYLGNFREIERTETTIKYGFKASANVAQIWGYVRTQAPGVTEPWPPDRAAVLADPSLAVAPNFRLTADTVEYVVPIPANGQVTYVQFQPVNASFDAGDFQRVRVAGSEQLPHLDKVHQTAGASGLFVAVSFDAVDPQLQGGTVRVWTNQASADSADPNAAADGTLAVVATPAHVGPTDVFTLAGGGTDTLLANVRTHPGKGKRVYFEFENAQGVSSGQIAVTLLANSTIIDDTGNLINGAITTASQFAAGITPVQVLSALPSSAPDGTVVLLTTDGQLYRRVSGAWTLAVPAVNITGQIVASQVADAAITTAKFAAGIRPVRIVSVLPGAGDLQGDTVFLTTDNKLYRWDGAAWTAAVPTVDLTGTITTAQITALAVTAALLAANAVTTTKIADDAVTTPKLIAGAVTAAKITAGTITSNEIAALTITASNIAASTITGGKIAANTITAGNIAADTITAGEIAASAISTSELAANAVTAAKIAVGTITANEIAANTITGGKIAAATITATNISAGTITSNELAANSIIAGKIAAGAINAAALIVDGTITALKLSVSVLSGISADLGTIVAGRLNSVNGHSYIDLNATGASAFIHHETGAGVVTLEILANGNATFSGTVASTTFTAAHATFSGDATFTGAINVDIGAGPTGVISILNGATLLATVGFDGSNFGLFSSTVGPIHLEAQGGFSVRFFAGGTAIGFIDGATIASGNTGLSISANRAGVVTVDQVTYGIANSGGAGFRLLRIPN